MNAQVDSFVRRASKWQPEMSALRTTLTGCGLDETFKWGKPCYGFADSNVAIIQPFKASCAVMFFKGSLMKDPKRVLVAPGANSQAGRRIEFTSLDEVKQGAGVLKAYVKEAIALEKSGARVEFKEKHELKLPEELASRMKAEPTFATAFRALTPGRQRAYVLHIAGAKQSATRASRVEKCAPRILAGRGLTDR